MSMECKSMRENRRGKAGKKRRSRTTDEDRDGIQVLLRMPRDCSFSTMASTLSSTDCNVLSLSLYNYEEC